MGIVLAILTVFLIFVSLFLILVVLAQKSKDGGMGAALGGGAAEAAFGAETSNVLSKSTIWAAVLFFILAFLLYLGRIYERSHGNTAAGSALPTITVPATPAPTATTTPAANVPAPATNAAAPASATPSASVTVPTASTTTSSAPAQTPPAPAPATKK
jgi:preprotein translocase subunit SecG